MFKVSICIKSMSNVRIIYNWSQFLNICHVSFVSGLNLAGLHNQMMAIRRRGGPTLSFVKYQLYTRYVGVGSPDRRSSLGYHHSNRPHETNQSMRPDGKNVSYWNAPEPSLLVCRSLEEIWAEQCSAVQCSGVVMEQPLPALIFKLLSLDDLQWQDVIFIG